MNSEQVRMLLPIIARGGAQDTHFLLKDIGQRAQRIGPNN